MKEDLARELEVVFELASKQADYIDRLKLLIEELWSGIMYARDALDEMEAAIADQVETIT
jgi:hypothetical protein